MDKIPGGGGGFPGGAGPDGAFERFLTAALATIITIMFSWRLLAEEEEARGGGSAGGLRGVQAPRQFPLTTSLALQQNTTRPHTTSTPAGNTISKPSPKVDMCEIDISEDEGVGEIDLNSRSDTDLDNHHVEKELVVYDQYTPQQQQQQQLGAMKDTGRSDDTSLRGPGADDSLTDDHGGESLNETLTTWDEYKWEEETGQERQFVIKTRRSLKDFITSPNTSVDSSGNESVHEGINIQEENHAASENVVVTSVPFTQRFANFEYSGGDSGYVDLYPDVESDSDVTDSSEEDGNYEMQVSDSDSDSERGGGSFYGVTTLDTIMEEFESDANDDDDITESPDARVTKESISERERERNINDVRNSTDDNAINTNVISADENDLDSVCDQCVLNDGGSNVCDIGCDNYVKENACDNDVSVNEILSDLDASLNEHECSKIDDQCCETEMIHSLQNSPALTARQTTEGLLKSSEAQNVECGLSLESSQATTVHDSLIGKKEDGDLRISPDKTTATRQYYSTDSSLKPGYKNAGNSNDAVNKQTLLDTGTNLPDDKNENQSKHELLALKLSGDDYKISEISDDSLPPSPIRTCALDNLADEPFSDTESCSSGSVITVLSVKSTDSDSRNNEKLSSHLPVNKQETARGKELSRMINDQNPDTVSKYEHFSLVSGFLNDSLNSLLSANTGSEAESSSDRESSGPDVTSSTQSHVQSDHVQLNGKLASDDSNVSSQESLPLVQEIVQSNAAISESEAVNGHTTSSDSLNTDTEQNNMRNLEQTPVIEDYVDSDGSSDSSDPPLREYDPDDDDLAAFQFNLDSDDDSFFLVIGDEDDSVDEGKLRNFTTFTNLNSVGLSSEYGDAFTSRALEEDARSFTFSRTEDVSTDYKRRGYVTDRSNVSDSESSGRGPLSPITSEDEDAKSEPTDSPVHRPQELPLLNSAYQDAPQSTIAGDIGGAGSSDLRTKPIDFNKYLIKSELSPISELASPISPSVTDQSNSSLRLIDDDQLRNDTKCMERSEIDVTSDKNALIGESPMNNLNINTGCSETLGSLTEQIEQLIENDNSLDTPSLHTDLDAVSEKPVPQDSEKEKSDVNNKAPVQANTGVKLDSSFEDLLAESENVDVCSPARRSKIETNIDDILESNKSAITEKIETNIDDILSDNSVARDTEPRVFKPSRVRSSSRRSRPSVLPTSSKVETNIDDVLTGNNAASPATPKYETNIDEITDHVQPETSHNVHSTPLTSHRETCIDDIVDTKPTENTVTVETSVDDLFDDVTNVKANILPSQPDNVKWQRPISHETCIDDVLESSQPEVETPEITSQCAIPVEGQCSPGRVITPVDKLPSDVHVNRVQNASQGVQPDKQLQSQNNTGVHDVNNPEQCIDGRETFVSEPGSISSRDKVIDKHVDKNTRDTGPSGILNTETISDQYWQFEVEPRRLLLTQGKIEDTHVSNIDSETLKTENIGKLKNRQNDNEASVSAQSTQNNDRALLVNYVNTSVSEFKDHNSNITVPKTEKLNTVANTSAVGQFPVNNSYNADNQTGISLLPKSPADRVLDSLTANSNAGISFHDIEVSLEDTDTNADETELQIVEEHDTSVASADNSNYGDDHLDSIGSCSLSLHSDEESFSSFDESYHSLPARFSASRTRGASDSSLSRIVRTPVTKPSDLYGKAPRKELKGVKKRIHQHHAKKFSSVLEQPVTPEKVHVTIELPERETPLSRVKVLKSRERFLSAENLSPDSFEDKFLKHRTSLVTSSTPRKYLKRSERDLQSTESLPARMAVFDSRYGSNASIERFHSPVSPRFEELYYSRYSSNNTSFEHSDYDKLHANCMFSPHKREEIEHTAKSLENMFEQLLRYGSVSSVAETDIDAPEDDHEFVSFQYLPLERAASMSALIGPSESSKLPRKPGKGRFANRKVPKSKSLQTLETNLDEVFADELGQGGEIKKTPSVHELRVSKSLSKLNVPDWFRKSSFSRSGSTQSLFTYAGRSGSTSTIGSHAYPPSLTSSPTPSVTPGGNTVIIQKRVTPSPTTPTSAKLLRAPMLPTTPERAPIHNTPPTLQLPSDRFRTKKDKDKLKPIPIVPFAKIREMFERKAQEDATKSPTSPTKESPTKEKPKVHFEDRSPMSEKPLLMTSHDTSQVNHRAPVQNTRTISPPPPIPERKPILAASSRLNESVPPRKPQQVKFSDDMQVSKIPEQNVESKPQNGTTQSTSVSSVLKKFNKRTASLPLPQFRFRRPGASKAPGPPSSTSSSPSSAAPVTQSKKGKPIVYSGDRGDYFINYDNCYNSQIPAWMHALQSRAKTDGETLFEFLQKRRYSSILENGFAEQMDELQDSDVTFQFPVMAVSNHSNSGDACADTSHDLRVILTNAYNNNVQTDFVDNKLRNDASVDDILDGLLLLDGHSTGRMRMDEYGRIVPKTSEEFPLTPDTPPGMLLNLGPHDSEQGNYTFSDADCDLNGDVQSEYVLVKCENPQCQRETNLKEARKYFKSCHSCFTYYCSRTCRKVHWAPHKLVCVYSRINSACKHVIKCINKQPHLQYQCSRIARRGYLSQGRGAVVFAFPDIGSAEDFLTSGMDSLWVPPVYISVKELPNATMLGSKLTILTDTCKQYNPELKYVIHVAIVIPPRLPFRPVPRRLDTILQKCAKLRLSPAHMHPKQEDTDGPSTLILTAVPGNKHCDDADGRKTRELCFVNIQRKLRHRGVSLRHQFPDVYNRLIDFVSDAKHFSPLIIYPSDGRTGKRFMCVIMPEAESEIEWIRDPDLFHELDVFDDDDGDTSTPSNPLTEVML